MSEATAKEYFEMNKDKKYVYICGDSDHLACGLDGKLVDINCFGCFRQIGQIWKTGIKEDAIIHYQEMEEKDYLKTNNS